MSWLKNNLFNAVSLLIGILGIISSFYFYSISIKNKEPVVVETTNIKVFSPSFTENKKFALIDNETEMQVKSDVFFQELALWNKGKEIIRSDDILSPIKTSYNENVKIIDVSISESTRPNIVKANLHKDKNDIFLDFSILEHKDGFKVQVIYAANEKTTATVNADIAGVQKMYTLNDLTYDNMLLGVGKVIMWVFIAILTLTILSLIIYGSCIALKRLFPKKYNTITNYINKFFSFLWISIIAASIFIFIIMKIYQVALGEASDSIPEMLKTKTQEVSDKVNNR